MKKLLGLDKPKLAKTPSPASTQAGRQPNHDYSSSSRNDENWSSPPSYSDALASIPHIRTSAQQLPYHSESTSSLNPWSRRLLTISPPDLRSKSTSSPSPFPRWGHSVSASATSTGELYLFGGLMGEIMTNDLYVLSTRDLSVKLLHTSSERPPPRVGHACALLSSVLIVWGGDTRADLGQIDLDCLDNGLYLLNLISREWTRVVVHGDTPSGRYGHGAAIVGSKFFVFGGQRGGEFLNDLWSFDLNELRSSRPSWARVGLSLSSPQPEPRTAFSCLSFEHRIVIFGGTDWRSHFNDTWIFDTSTKTWSSPCCIGSVPSPRESHAAVMVDDMMFIFGGRGPNGGDLQEGVRALKISTQLWFTFSILLGPEPHARAGHALAAAGSTVYVLGGGDAGAADPNVIDILETRNLKFPPDSMVALSASSGQVPPFEKSSSREKEKEDRQF